jgi:hypothetical protein
VVNNARISNANAIIAQVRRRIDSWYLDSLEPLPDCLSASHYPSTVAFDYFLASPCCALSFLENPTRRLLRSSPSHPIEWNTPLLTTEMRECRQMKAIFVNHAIMEALVSISPTSRQSRLVLEPVYDT